MSYEDIKIYYKKKYENFFIQLIYNYEKKRSQSVMINNLEVKSVRYNFNKHKYCDYLKIEILAVISIDDHVKNKKYKIKTKVDFQEPEVRWIGKCKIKECNSLKFHKNIFYEEYMVPFLKSKDMEDFALSINLCKIFTQDTRQLLAKVANIDSLKYIYAKLPETILGRIYLRDGELKVYENNKEHVKKIKKDTIVINTENKYMNKYYCEKIIKAHEEVHKMFHNKYFKIRSLLENDLETLDFNFDFSLMDETWSNKQKADWLVERQANTLALCICIPEDGVRAKLDNVLQKGNLKENILDMPNLMEDAIRRLSLLYEMPFSFVKSRALQLGYDTVLGSFISVDNQNWDSIYFPKGTLKNGQTFIIDKQGLENVCAENKYLKNALDSGELIYLGYVVSKNDKKYVQRIDSDCESETKGYEYKLTDYGRAHADECCQIFFLKEIGEENLEGIYNCYYLNYGFSAHTETHYEYNPKFKDDQKDEELKKEIELFKNGYKKISNTFADEKYQKLKTGADFLNYHMDKKNISIYSLANRTLLSETTIKRYKKGAKPSLPNLMAIFIGLNLHEEFCDDMMNAYGIQFPKHGMVYKVYRKLIREHSDGNIQQWNRILKEFNYSEIPDKRGQRNC